jgi:prolyl oligopeptidase
MEFTLHGQTVSDPWRWLEDLDSPETRTWIDAQNERTFRFLESVSEREDIRRRVTELWNYPRCGLPYKEGGKYFYLTNDGLQNQWVLRVRDGLDSAARVLIDPNTLSEDGTVALTATSSSRDGRLLAYGLSRAGSDWEEWRVMDVETGTSLPDCLQWVKFSSISWTPNGKGFFYCRYEPPDSGDEYEVQNFHHKLYYHRIGDLQSQDELIYARPDRKEWNFRADVTDDGRYLMIHVWSASNYNLLFYRDLSAAEPVVELIPNFEARYQFIGNDGPVFWLFTDLGASRGQVVAIDTSFANVSTQKTIVPEREETLEQVTVVGENLIACYLANAYTRIHVLNLDGSFIRELSLPGIGTATGFNGKRGDPETFFDFTGFTTPITLFRYDAATDDLSPFFRPPLNFDPDQFETRQVFYDSRDGTRVSMFIASKKGLKLNGTNPVELYGYGGFGISITPSFSSSRIAWMEMGGVFAAPNLRGGGEYGEQWHLAGTRERKQNVFDDFIAAAEWLIENCYTSSERLAITGRSNGGLLVGACLTQRPDLFGAAVPGVGVMDMLRFHKFTIGWSWVSDYGSPENPEDFQTLFAYSPYHNIRPGTEYPATLITTGDHDDRVVPGHSYKFAAALQAAQAGPAPVLIRVEVRAGHGIGKPVSKQIGEVVDSLAFLVKVLREPSWVV